MNIICVIRANFRLLTVGDKMEDQESSEAKKSDTSEEKQFVTPIHLSEGSSIRLRSGKMVPQLSDDDTIELIEVSSFKDKKKKKVSVT